MYTSRTLLILEAVLHPRVWRQLETRLLVLEADAQRRPEEDTEPVDTLPTHKIPDAVKHVTGAINAAGGRALVVGGAVRDMLMGKEPKDHDIEAYGMHPDELAHHLGKIGKVDAVGKSFGVLKIKHGGEDLDVSIPRREQKTGKGTKGFMATPDPSMTISEAGKRRDFTMNSVSMDPHDGRLYDPHNGIADIKSRTLRATDSRAFAEDPLRILRGAQFAARHKMTVHPDTMKLMQNASHELKDLPKERVHAEWKKLLSKGEEPSRGLDVLHHSGALKALHPELHATEGDTLDHTKRAMDHVVAHSKELSPISREAVHHATLLHHVGGAEVAHRISSEQLGAHKDAAAKVKNLVGERDAPHVLHQKGEQATEGDIRRLAGRLHPATIEELARVHSANHAAHTDSSHEAPASKWLLQKAQEHGVHNGPTKPLLTGKHLAEMGVKQGPKVGEVIKHVLNRQLDGHVKTVDDAKEEARRHLAGDQPSLHSRVMGEPP